MLDQSIQIVDRKGVALGAVAPQLLESLDYISQQSGLPWLPLLEASLALFIACTSATLGPAGMLPKIR